MYLHMSGPACGDPKLRSESASVTFYLIHWGGASQLNPNWSGPISALALGNSRWTATSTRHLHRFWGSELWPSAHCLLSEYFSLGAISPAPHILFLKSLFTFENMYGCSVYIFICVPCVCNAHKGQKRSLGLELYHYWVLNPGLTL